MKKKKKGANNKSNKKINHKPFSKNNLFQKVKAHWIWSLLGIVLFTVSCYSPLKEIYKDLFAKKQIEEMSESTVETINELNRLNAIFDKNSSEEVLDKIVEILVFNLSTSRNKNFENFNQQYHNKLFYNSSTIDNPNNYFPFNGLVATQITYGGKQDQHEAKFIAKIKGNDFLPEIQFLPFEFWWEQQIILNDRNGNVFTRKSLIMSYALYRRQGDFQHLKEFETLNEFKNYRWKFMTEMQTVEIDTEGNPKKSFIESPKLMNNKLLNEVIRAISGEFVETLIKLNVKSY